MGRVEQVERELQKLWLSAELRRVREWIATIVGSQNALHLEVEATSHKFPADVKSGAGWLAAASFPARSEPGPGAVPSQYGSRLLG